MRTTWTSQCVEAARAVYTSVHQTHRWKPRMKPYIYGERSASTSWDLSQTVPALHQALFSCATRLPRVAASVRRHQAPRRLTLLRKPPALAHNIT